MKFGKSSHSITRQILVYALLIAVLGGLFLIAKGYASQSQKRLAQTQQESVQDSETAQTAAKVKVCSVFYQPLTDILKLPGTVEAYEDIDLACKIGGTIQWLGVEEGDRVSAGQRLLQLDMESTQAQRERARANYELAQQNFDRIASLAKERVVSQEEFDSAQATLKSAQATLEETTAMLTDGTLHSPITGSVDRRPVDEGEHVAEGQTVMKIVDIDRVKVVFNLPEKDVHYFKTGQNVKLWMQNSELHELEGTVEFVAMVADEQSHTYPLKVLVANEDHLLRPGMIVTAQLVRRQVEKGIAVPFFTMVERQSGKSVFVVQDGRAVERSVEYGMFQNGMVEILKGLEAGDQLVVTGQRELVSGQQVSIQDDLTTKAQQAIAAGLDLSNLIMR